MMVFKALVLCGVFCLCPVVFFAKGDPGIGKEAGSDSLSKKSIHRLELAAGPAYIFPTHAFFQGENLRGKPIRGAVSGHLRYSFQFAPGTYAEKRYGGAYQGIGLNWFTFGNPEELGNPVAFYIFQGARIARLNSFLSLNYEWNLGLSFGWKPYHIPDNSLNQVIGSRMNAYMNADFYLNWMLSDRIDLATGVSLTHFSNGNTQYPNAGLNTIGLKAGLVYRFSDQEQPPLRQNRELEVFERHISYDLVFFGSWRRKGLIMPGGDPGISPDYHTVLGMSFSPMYNLCRKLRLGLSLDAVYDASANLYVPDFIVGTTPEFVKPPLARQLALGISGKVEYVMPYFTIGLGLGTNVLHGGGDLKSVYQTLALKVAVTRSSFIHIGYCLHNFSTPNFLMLGIGFRIRPG